MIASRSQSDLQGGLIARLRRWLRRSADLDLPPITPLPPPPGVLTSDPAELEETKRRLRRVDLLVAIKQRQEPANDGHGVCVPEG